jgi:hypothetical protein
MYIGATVILHNGTEDINEQNVNEKLLCDANYPLNIISVTTFHIIITTLHTIITQAMEKIYGMLSEKHQTYSLLLLLQVTYLLYFQCYQIQLMDASLSVHNLSKRPYFSSHYDAS